MKRSPEQDAPPVKRNKSGGGAGKAIGGFFRFLLFVGLIGAVAYNSYQVMELRAELDSLRNSAPSPRAAVATPSGKRPVNVARTGGEPNAAALRQKQGEGMKSEPQDALAMLQKAREDAQAASNRTMMDLQQRLSELSARVEGMTSH